MKNNKLEFKKFRVRTPIKSFRDLEVYQNTTKLSAEIYCLKLPEKYRKKKELQEELGKLKEISKHVPRLISESHGDKFTNLNLALNKLEKTAHVIDRVVTKADFLNAIIEKEDFKEKLLDIIKRYQIARRKILNLKRSWERVFGGGNFKKGWKQNRKMKNKFANNKNDKTSSSKQK